MVHLKFEKKKLLMYQYSFDAPNFIEFKLLTAKTQKNKILNLQSKEIKKEIFKQ